MSILASVFNLPCLFLVPHNIPGIFDHRPWFSKKFETARGAACDVPLCCKVQSVD